MWQGEAALCADHRRDSKEKDAVEASGETIFVDIPTASEEIGVRTPVSEADSLTQEKLERQDSGISGECHKDNVISDKCPMNYLITDTSNYQ